MNYLRLSLAAGALTLTIALSTLAGEMQTTVTSPLSDGPTAEATGDISLPGVYTNSVIDVALSLAQSVLALF